MNLESITIMCDCGRPIKLSPKKAKQDDSGDPLVSLHECFCGREMSMAIDSNTEEGFHINVDEIIKVAPITNINEPVS